MDFELFKNPVYPYGFKEDLIARLKLTSSEKAILCSDNIAATFQLSDISLIWYTTRKIDDKNLFVHSLLGFLQLFLDKLDDFANKNEFYNP